MTTTIPAHLEEYYLQKDGRLPASRRGYSYDWQLCRADYIAANPVCECCGSRADEVDHIEPITGDLDPKRLDHSNLRSLCRPCHRSCTANFRRNGINEISEERRNQIAIRREAKRFARRLLRKGAA